MCFERESAALDELALPLREGLAGVDPVEEQVQVLSSYVFDRLGFHGNEEDYYDPKNSYLNEVRVRRTGVPITLAVLLMSLGKRAGIQVEGIGFPGHFLVRVGGAEGTLIDPFFGGKLLTEAALHRLASRFLGSPDQLRPEHLNPVSPRSMCVRMLVNLKHAHERRRDHARALVVCDRLVDLTGSASFIRDRGLHALALGAAASALFDLREYLRLAPKANDLPAVKHAIRRAQSIGDTRLQ